MRARLFFLCALLIIATFLGGCAIKSVTTHGCLSDEEKDTFAEIVAQKVIELQEQQSPEDK